MAHGFHTCAIGGPSQAVYCWGAPLLPGERDEAVPRAVPGLPPARGIAMGKDHACAVTTDGDLFCWGDNAYGQLGTAPSPGRQAPKRVELTGPVVEVVAGAHHTCVRFEQGGIECWGDGSRGQLGAAPQPAPASAGACTCPLAPVEAPSATPSSSSVSASSPLLHHRVPIPGARGLAAGDDHTCAIVEDGSVWCWGDDTLGLASGVFNAAGPQARVARPTQVPGLRDIAAIFAGGYTSYAFSTAGAVWVWGAQVDGEVLAQITAVEFGDPVVELAVGRHHALARDASGKVTCWGRGYHGPCGVPRGRDGTARRAMADGATSVTVGEEHSCVRTRDGGVRCWGLDDHGQLGDGATVGARPVPAPVEGLDRVVSLGSGRRHGCAAREGGGVRCWGANNEQQLGNAEVGFSARPVDVPWPEAMTEVALGFDRSFGRTAQGQVVQWGTSRHCEIHLRSEEWDFPEPSRFSLPAPSLALASDDWADCALLVDGRVLCRGGLLGTGRRVCTPDLVEIPLGARARAIAAGGEWDFGSRERCAILESGSVACWAENDAGSSTFRRLVVRPVEGIPGRAKSLSVADTAGCVCTNSGAVWCWPHADQREDPTAIVARRVETGRCQQVSVAPDHACALLRSGAVACWGANGLGQLGTGDFVARTTATPVIELPDARAVATGSAHTCALLRDGTVRCWGARGWGQLGDGSGGGVQLAPVDVVGLPTP